MNNDIKSYIKDKLSLVPLKPGCYQMYNKDGVIIYVGKAKLLQNRLKSYFTGAHDAKTTQMVSEVVNFEYIITNSEKEAFLLEHNFIKEYRPFYNILLMDDKTYPYIVITNETSPRVIVSRDISKMKKRNGYKLYGPYPNVKACNDAVEVINKVYPFRKCHEIPKKKCIYYDMHNCLAPCINKITRNDYQEYLDKVTKFLNGTSKDVLQELNNLMLKASDNLEFEKALEYKELIDSISIVPEKEKITLNDGITRDIFGYYVKNDTICIQVLHMRQGKIIERNGEIFDLVDDLDEVFLSFIYEFYDSNKITVPEEILIPDINDYQILEELLDTKVIVPKIGLKKQLVDMVSENAFNKADSLEKLKLLKISKTKEPLIELQNILNITFPKVIELFDNSNIQGVSSISAMVTYIDGVPSYKDYRKYNVKTVIGADDFHTMQEVLTRRYKRVIKDNLRKPNLVIVDGGLPQVMAAQEIFENLNITDINLIGLEKDDHHRTKSIVTIYGEHIDLDKHSNLFLLLEAMQDEVHRFAITFFRNKHTKNTFKSIIDSIEGIGDKRKKMILSSFDSIDDLKHTSIENLRSLGIPKDTAEKLLNELNK